MNEIVKKAKLVLVNPRKFFEEYKSEDKIEPSFKYRLITVLVNLILGGIISFVVIVPLTSNLTGQEQTVTPETLIPQLIIGYIIGILFAFVASGLLHLWIKLFSGKGSFTKTFQLYVYADTPRMLFGWVPIIGQFVAPIYGLIILVIGATVVHGFTNKKSFLVLALPAIIVTVLALLGLFAGLAFLTAYLTSSMSR